MAMPATIFDNLTQLGVKAVNVLPEDHIDAFGKAIREVGQLIGKQDKANQVASQWKPVFKHYQAQANVIY